MSDKGDLTYVNLCGDTTTSCSPASPVCRRSGLWSTMGYGDLETQTFKPISLFSSFFIFFSFFFFIFFFLFFLNTADDGVEKGQGVSVVYNRGEYCPGTDGTTAIINVICGKDESISDLKMSSDGCTVTITIKSQAGCGVLISSTDGGEVFAIVVLVLFVITITK